MYATAKAIASPIYQSVKLQIKKQTIKNNNEIIKNQKNQETKTNNTRQIDKLTKEQLLLHIQNLINSGSLTGSETKQLVELFAKLEGMFEQNNADIQFVVSNYNDVLTDKIQEAQNDLKVLQDKIDELKTSHKLLISSK